MSNYSHIRHFDESIYRSFFNSELTWLCLGVAVLCLAGIFLSVRAIWRMRRRQRLAALATDSRAVATIEFTLVLPVLLFMILLLTQTTLLMGGNMFVHYAAFAATRSAIAYIPQDTETATELPVGGSGDPANVFTASSGQSKYDAILQSAYLALAPVAGRSSSEQATSTAITTGLDRLFSGMGKTTPNWVDELIAERVNYASANTMIEVLIPVVIDEQTIDYIKIPEGSVYTFSPRDPVTVNVIHRFNLSTPWVNRIYADESHGERMYYREVYAGYTLTNEGLRDELPPQPSLPRQP